MSFMVVKSARVSGTGLLGGETENFVSQNTHPVRGLPYILTTSPVIPRSRTTSSDMSSGLLVVVVVGVFVSPKDDVLIVAPPREPCEAMDTVETVLPETKVAPGPVTNDMG
jgi:hypothetical protein